MFNHHCVRVPCLRIPGVLERLQREPLTDEVSHILTGLETMHVLLLMGYLIPLLYFLCFALF